MGGKQMRNKFNLLITFIVLSLVLNGCIYGRRTFAQKTLKGSENILGEYRKYVNEDMKLNTDDKRFRLGTADEFENFLKEGAK
ncbi:MAG: hypothetical protein KA059_00415 [Elusimicrobiales bacterium]|nr:hypothetical protein [Elusimicrobiales bacterium]